MGDQLLKPQALAVKRRLSFLDAAIEGVEPKILRELGVTVKKDGKRALSKLLWKLEDERKYMEHELGLDGNNLWIELKKKQHLSKPIKGVEDRRWNLLSERYYHLVDENPTLAETFNDVYRNQMSIMMLVLVKRNTDTETWGEDKDNLFERFKIPMGQTQRESAKLFVEKILGIDYEKVRKKGIGFERLNPIS
ncbi:MAG: hypothetical protein ABH950_03190 [Candidatus Altiarchaeota archaeon]